MQTLDVEKEMCYLFTCFFFCLDGLIAFFEFDHIFQIDTQKWYKSFFDRLLQYIFHNGWLR